MIDVDVLLAEASARMAALPDEEKRGIHLRNVTAAHLVVCCPIEVLEGGDKHKWHRDKQPALNGEGCVCGGNGFRVLDADYFIAKRAGRL